MDADLWASRLSAAKRHHALQQTQQQWDRLSVDDFEVDDELRPEFTCPYCYEDFDIVTLSSHLEVEHLLESKGVVCPLCAAKVLKDMVGHMTVQHGHLFKMQHRRRFRRAGVPPGSTLSLLGKEYREAHLQALLGGMPFRNSASSASNTAADSLLSALSQSLSVLDFDELSKQNQFVNKDTPMQLLLYKPNIDVALSAEERAQKLKQATLRARFAQHLVLSTLADES